MDRKNTILRDLFVEVDKKTIERICYKKHQIWLTLTLKEN